MSNCSAFTTRNKNASTISDLYDQLSKLYEENNETYDNYIEALTKLLQKNKNKPMRAAEIAAKLTNDEDERISIRASIGSLGAAASTARYEQKRGFEKPASARIPQLHKKVVPTVRRFAELDENDNPIRIIEKEGYTSLYYWED